MKKILSIAILAICLSPSLVLAQVVLPTMGVDKTSGTLTTSASDNGVGSDNPKASNFQIVPCTGVVKPDGTGKECDFNQLIIGFNRILKFIFYISVPIVMVMILYTGFKYLTANGDPGKLGDAKKMLMPVAIGLFWLAAGYVIIFTIIDKFVSPAFVQDVNNGPAKILGK